MSAAIDSGVMTFEQSQSALLVDARLEACMHYARHLNFYELKVKLAVDMKWTVEYCDEVEELYRQFLALNKRYPGKKICPNAPIDAFWHAHILDTRAYAKDCEYLFDGFLHHYPYFGMTTEEFPALQAAFAETDHLFILHFGVSIATGEGGGGARSCSPQRCP